MKYVQPQCLFCLSSCFSGGSDYLAINSQSLIVSAGTSSACVTVTVVDDTVPEPSLEFFNLVVTSSDPDVSFSTATALVAIQNDDGT